MTSVKCYYCGEYFDRDSIEYIKPNSRRYAHKICPNIDNKKIQEQQIIDNFYRYARKILGDDFTFVRIRQQVEEYLKEPYNFTYEGMTLSLKYWYEVKKNSIDKAKGAVGIIPYIYNDAKRYYTDIYNAQQANKNKDLKSINKTKIIKAKIPKRETKPLRFFDF